MSQDTPDLPVHPAGEQPPIEQNAALAPATLSTWAGPVRVEWDPTAPLTPYGQLPFFIEFLKVAGLFDALVADCPLAYTSPNAPDKRDVLGTTMLSILAGHKRYAHITALRNDGVLPELLGMEKIVSEDAVRWAFKVIGDNEGKEWLQGHLDYCTAPLLAEPWAMDTDSTIKPLYGHQEGAVLGYNPKKRLTAVFRIKAVQFAQQHLMHGKKGLGDGAQGRIMLRKLPNPASEAPRRGASHFEAEAPQHAPEAHLHIMELALHELARGQKLQCTGRNQPSRISCAIPCASLRSVFTGIALKASRTCRVSKSSTANPVFFRPA